MLKCQPRLKDITIYLAGPIDNAKDLGVSWRREFQEKVKSLNANISVLDPTNKPLSVSDTSETQEEQNLIKNFKKNEQWDELTKFVKKFRRVDLRCVDHANLVVVYIDPSIHMLGSYDEILTAEDQHKPILAIIEGGRQRASSWLFAVMKWQEMFSSIDECIEYLNQMNSGEIELDDRWVFLKERE